VYPPSLYNWSVAFISHLSLAWFSFFLITICYRSSKSINSIKAINEFLYFVMSSCLLACQFPFVCVCVCGGGVFVWVCVWVCVCVGVCMGVCVGVCMGVCVVGVFVWVCMGVYGCVCVWVFVCVCNGCVCVCVCGYLYGCV
jgi:hypothetical protein